MMPYLINIKGTLVSLQKPAVMGILNVTPNSFYANSRKQTEKEIYERMETILSEGATFVDIGGYSSRPDAEETSEAEERSRLALALNIALRHFPEARLSVDTFRSAIAKEAVEVYGASMINDISAGELDKDMFRVVAELKVPYAIMHMRGTPQTMQKHCDYADITEDVLKYFAAKMETLRLMGVSDIVVDPGFGFSKTLEQNYELLSHLHEFRLLDAPLLVGVSRKSMIYKLTGGTPSDSLTGTIALHMYALQKGANILRVHDVREAMETVMMNEALTPTIQA